MNCDLCGETLKNGIIAFCEKCEKYYCMNCYTKHRKHQLIFKRLSEGRVTNINTGISGAGIGDTHQKFYKDENWVLRHHLCEHVKEDMELGKVIFYCSDGNIRCSKCFYESNLNKADPIMKNDENKLLLLLTHTYEPQNLEFTFDCDDEGIKGEEIGLHLTIINNKLHDIEDINIDIEAFAAKPLPKNTSLNMYRETMQSKYLILKTFHYDVIKSKTEFKIELKVRIPKNREINKNQIVNLVIDDKIKNEYVQDALLNVPDNLMIYAHFSYKTYSGF